MKKIFVAGQRGMVGSAICYRLQKQSNVQVITRTRCELDLSDQFAVQHFMQAEKIDDNDCSEGTVIGGLLGAGIALSSSRGKDRFWAVPAGGTAGALIGCQVDGG